MHKIVYTQKHVLYGQFKGLFKGNSDYTRFSVHAPSERNPGESCDFVVANGRFTGCETEKVMVPLSYLMMSI
jgi:hypothetical protein